MDNSLATDKAQRAAGNMGYILMAIGNVGVLFFVVTIGFEDKVVLADTIWCVVLDISAIIITVYMWRKNK